jgi:hypothetical protein
LSKKIHKFKEHKNINTEKNNPKKLKLIFGFFIENLKPKNKNSIFFFVLLNKLHIIMVKIDKTLTNNKLISIFMFLIGVKC